MTKQSNARVSYLETEEWKRQQAKNMRRLARAFWRSLRVTKADIRRAKRRDMLVGIHQRIPGS